MTSTARTEQRSVEQAKAALREFAAEADQSAMAALGPLSKYAKQAGMVGAGLAVASVIFGRTKLVGSILKNGVRLVPMILKFL